MKDDLLQLINAYGDARASGNSLLQQWATHSLSTFLETCEVISVAREVEAISECSPEAAEADAAE